MGFNEPVKSLRLDPEGKVSIGGKAVSVVSSPSPAFPVNHQGFGF